MPRNITDPLIVIFGRTNVGKSTLFNCLVEKRSALVSDAPGTTRDANLSDVEWRGQHFSIVDTGGFMDFDFLRLRKIKAESIDEMVQKQARDYLKRADLILFVVDTRDGLLPQDKVMAAILKRIIPDKEKIMVIANKTDKFSMRPSTVDFLKLGLGEVMPVSAATGSGTGDMLDAVLEKVTGSPEPTITSPEPLPDAIKVAIIGKPNVGKSSLLNSILGYPRVIVSPIPHTTREPQSERIIYKGKTIVFVDTAGLTKQGHKSDTLEKDSMNKSLASVKKSDLAVLVLDITEPLTKQDSRIVEEIFERQKSLILVANKWDKIEDRDPKKYTRSIYGDLPFATYSPIQFISAKNHTRVPQFLDLIVNIDAQRRVQISDSQLEKLLKTAVRKHRPTKGRGTKYPHIYEFIQTGVNPPTFKVRVGVRESLAETYLRFLENQLRARFGFLGTPIKMWVQKGRDVHGAHDS